MLEKLYFHYKLATVQIPAIGLGLAAPYHAARAHFLAYIDAIVAVSGSPNPRIFIHSATEEQERQARLLISDLYAHADVEVEYTTPEESDVAVIVRGNWSCVIQGEVDGEMPKWEMGALPQPPIRDGKTPDEYHGFDVASRTEASDCDV